MNRHEAWHQLQDDLHSAITDVFHKFAEEYLGEEEIDYNQFRGMCQGYFLLTEWHGLDGQKKVDMTASADARLWEIDGWINYVEKDLQAQHIINLMEKE